MKTKIHIKKVSGRWMANSKEIFVKGKDYMDYERAIHFCFKLNLKELS